ncbi:hypothetical protein [Bradyrhizobium sp. USDA 336]|uniref:hypothetical protein n=1 Tax=Bradyrhizobium sp. USDA 336 TaxID=3156311 RepID=UPI00384D92A7
MTDPLKLRASSSTLADSIERSLAQLDKLREVSNYNVQQRLDQIRAIALEVIDKGQSAVAEAIHRMTLLEKEIYEDAVRLIARVECAVENVNSRLQAAFAEILKQLVKADPRIEVAGYKAMEFIVNPVQIQNPNEAYRDAKEKAFRALGKDHFTDRSNAADIFWTYQNLKVMARWTRCRYDASGATALTLEMNELERLSEPWINVINVKLF